MAWVWEEAELNMWNHIIHKLGRVGNLTLTTNPIETNGVAH